MQHKLITLAGLLFLLSGAGGCNQPIKQQTQMNITCIKQPGLPGIDGKTAFGVSAPFAGFSNGMLLIAGGCNFPDKPVTEGGTKRYYSEVFVLDTAKAFAQGWQKACDLPVAVAYGATISTPDGIVCIGGNNAEASFRSVYLLKWNTRERRVETILLPELPAAMDNHAATAANGCLYVAGGNEEGKACNSFLMLDLKQGADAAWIRLPDFPGPARVQPVLAAQQAKTGTGIYLAGGFQPLSGNQKAVIPTDLWVYYPETNEWKPESQIPAIDTDTPRTFTGGCAIAFGDSSILLMGGVNYNRFEPALNRPLYIRTAEEQGQTALADSLQKEGKEYLLHPVDWYRFNTALLQYNTFTGEWTNLGDYEPLARAGAGAAIDGNRLFIANGELKPGIRTPEVNLLVIEE